MITLIGKEMRLLLRNVVFYLMVVAAGLFYFSQYAAPETWRDLKAPEMPQLTAEGNYGYAPMTDAKRLAETNQGMMQRDLDSGRFMKYTFGFGRNEKLSAKEKGYFQEAIAKLDPIIANPDSYTAYDVEAISIGLNKKLGGTTHYAPGMYTSLLPIETKEEAEKIYADNMRRYNEKVAQHQLYPGAARLFCDYVGMTAGIFPVFISAFILTRDKSSRMHELIYSRKISAWKYVGGKFVALGLLLSVIYLLFAVAAAFQTVGALNQEKELWTVLPVFIGYAAGWLLPTIWMTTAFGMFINVLFRRGIVAIPLQLVWWFLSVMPLTGSYGLEKLFLRFNTPDEYELFRDSLRDITLNRISYGVVAFVLAAGAALLWERNRSRSAGKDGRKRKSKGKDRLIGEESLRSYEPGFEASLR
ncbi:ABC transporter permease [Gorillibacterium massiliense]|uniref:ABC transporter permease n=1 Tax=Gorillibacterium massiliense TaxID=1280390 RepID=UPI0004B58972|nr:ABC transporter permease [Gorillibacterium massiliense]